jgi:hypothetical protein
MAFRFQFVTVPPIVLGRMLGALVLVSIVAFYFVARNVGMIEPIYSARAASPEERRALGRHNAEVKRVIALREARSVAAGASDRAERIAQAARDAPPPPAEPPPAETPSSANEPAPATE